MSPVSVEQPTMNPEISTTNSSSVEELKKYKDAEESFQSLAIALTSGPSFSVMDLYQKCYTNLQNIISTESQPVFMETLKEIRTSIEWQLSHYEAVLPHSATPDTQGELCPGGRRYKKVKVEKQTCPASFRKEALLATTGSSSCSASLSDIAGLDHVKSVLRKSVLLPLQCPDLFIGRKTWNHILLYGPPGTGKSKIAAAVANDSHLLLFSISSADLLSQWVGESEKTIKELFEVARSQQKTSIVFIDEIDSMCRKRNDSEGDYSRRLKNQFLIEMDNNLNSDKRCILICATNCPWDLDVAFMRRFQCRVFLPLPDKAARLKILRDQSQGVSVNMSEDEWQTMATLTDGYSGADLTNLVMYAVQEPLEEFEYNPHPVTTERPKWRPSTLNELPAQTPPPEKVGIRDVKFEDFKKALLTTPKSVTSSELGKFHVFMEQTS